jgi:hypothetical protein
MNDKEENEILSNCFQKNKKILEKIVIKIEGKQMKDEYFVRRCVIIAICVCVFPVGLVSLFWWK